MQITVTHDDGTTADITEGVLAALRALEWGDDLDVDGDDEDAILSLDDALDVASTHRIAEGIRWIREEREAAQRRRDEFARTEAARKADREKAAAHLAAEMRAAEPSLVAAGWTDAQLVELHRVRNAGLA